MTEGRVIPAVRRARLCGPLFRKGNDLTGFARGAWFAALVSIAVWGGTGRAYAGRPSSPPTSSVPSISPTLLKEGTRGVAYTVFHGDVPRPFEVEILGVLSGSRPKGSLILFKALGDTLAGSGIVAGMSGSPVYVDGKIIGAIAFSFPFSKEAIGMITPIEEMREGMARTNEPAAPWMGIAADVYQPMLDGYLRGTVDQAAWDRLVPEPARASGGSPLISLCGTGWASDMESPLDVFSRRTGLPLVPISGAVPAPATTASDDSVGLVPGSAVAVMLVDGDASLSAIGTMTERQGDHVVAFGHPLFQAGPVSLPLTTANIITIVPSLNSSFKMGTMGHVIGTIRQDLRAGVSGNLGEVPPTLPVRVSVNGPGGREVYNYRLARGFLLEPTMMAWVVTNSFLQRGWRLGEASVDGHLLFHYNKTQVLERRDRIAAKAPATEIAEQLLSPIPILLSNPFQPVIADSVSIDVDYSVTPSQSTLIDFWAERAKARAGEEISLTAKLQNRRGEVQEVPITIHVPERWHGENLLILAGGIGDLTEWDRDRAPALYQPKDFHGLERMIHDFPDAGELIIRIYGAEQGVLLGDREVGPLPSTIESVLGAAHKRGPAQSAPSFLLEERRIDAGGVVTGGIGVRVQVE